MTGCYPNGINKGGWKLASEEITIAEVLKEEGYQTGCIGKWDISGRKFEEGMVPNDQGFDYYFGTLGAYDLGSVTLWRNKEQLRETKDMGPLISLYTDEAKGASTDAAEVSWITPAAAFSVTTSAEDIPWHNWATTACHGTDIGHKSAVVAAKIIVLTATDLLLDKKLLNEAKKFHNDATNDRPYVSPLNSEAEVK